MYDVIIIGAGPGGMTAAIYAARANLNVLMIEKGIYGGQMMNTSEIENYPSYKMISGQELSEEMYEHATSLGAKYTYGEVKEIETIHEKHHKVHCGKEVYETKTVIIASGATPRKADIIGEDEFGGRGVSYCAICDGAFFKNKELVVIGGGDSAVEEAVYLTKFADKVTVFHRKDKFSAQKVLQDRLFDNDKIEVKFNSVTKEIKGDKSVQSVVLEEDGVEKTFETNGVFVYVGMKPITDFVPVHLLNDRKYISTNEKMETSQKGIYAK